MLTPWSRVLLEKLTVSQLVKKFPAFYETRRFIIVFIWACHLSLSWVQLQILVTKYTKSLKANCELSCWKLCMNSNWHDQSMEALCGTRHDINSSSKRDQLQTLCRSLSPHSLLKRWQEWSHTCILLANKAQGSKISILGSHCSNWTRNFAKFQEQDIASLWLVPEVSKDLKMSSCDFKNTQ